jgi:hypothetical protein
MATRVGFIGYYFLHVIDGKNVLACDTSGTSDPYVVVDYTPVMSLDGGGSDSVGENHPSGLRPLSYKTSIHYRTLNPFWGDRGRFVLPVYGAPATIDLNMWDKDEFTSDDFMGFCELVVDSSSPSARTELVLPLGNAKAKVSKKLRREPSAMGRRKEKDRGTMRVAVQYLRFGEFWKAFLAPPFSLLRVVMKLAEADPKRVEATAVAASGILLSRSAAVAAQAVAALIEGEVEACQHEATLFRTDSAATKVMRAVAEAMASRWRADLLRPLVLSLMAEAQSLEVDPSRIAEGAKLEENQNLLRSYTDRFLAHIAMAEKTCPAELKAICRSIAELTEAKFPGSGLKSVGGFVCLRFLCPAITTPESIDVGATVDDRTRRNLLLIVKMIQTLANLSEFGKKEPFMEPFNEWVHDRYALISEFFVAMQQPPAAPGATNHEGAPSESELFAHMETVFSVLDAGRDRAEELLEPSNEVHLLDPFQTIAPLYRMRRELVEESCVE